MKKKKSKEFEKINFEDYEDDSDEEEEDTDDYEQEDLEEEPQRVVQKKKPEQKLSDKKESPQPVVTLTEHLDVIEMNIARLRHLVSNLRQTYGI